MTDNFLLIASAVSVGAFVALELHGALRRRRRRLASTPDLRIPKPAAWCEPPPAPEPKALPTFPGGLYVGETGQARQQQRLEQLARNLLDPDVFGHAVTPEVRNAARTALGRATVKSSK